MSVSARSWRSPPATVAARRRPVRPGRWRRPSTMRQLRLSDQTRGLMSQEPAQVRLDLRAERASVFRMSACAEWIFCARSWSRPHREPRLISRCLSLNPPCALEPGHGVGAAEDEKLGRGPWMQLTDSTPRNGPPQGRSAIPVEMMTTWLKVASITARPAACQASHWALLLVADCRHGSFGHRAELSHGSGERVDNLDGNGPAFVVIGAGRR